MFSLFRRGCFSGRRLGGGDGGERSPLDFLATVGLLDGEARVELAGAAPEAANWMLAVVTHLLVRIAV